MAVLIALRANIVKIYAENSVFGQLASRHALCADNASLFGASNAGQMSGDFRASSGNRIQLEPGPNLLLLKMWKKFMLELGHFK